MATQRLAAWTVSLQYTDLPKSVTQAAVRSFYNWAGCALGGSNHRTTTTALEALAPFFGPATSSILGRAASKNDNSNNNLNNLPSRADASHAALINGIASHVHDYDDTHLETIIHPTGPVASALLAQAEALGNVGGQQFILALVAGIEAECKLGLAVWPKHYDVGWHITSTTGSIGAAVAVGKILHLSEEQMSHAIGIAATQVTGLREMFGSDTKSFHVGRSAQNGLMAAILASKGYTSSLQALEAKRGWANVVSETQRLDDQISTLGQKTPQDGLQAKFSVYHGGAAGLVLGKAGPAQYDDSVVRSQDIISVRDKIDAVADDKLGADETEIVVEFSNGEKLTKHVTHAIGSLEVPMTDQQLEDKFIDQVTEALGSQKASEASQSCWTIGDAASAGDLVRTL
ncbi:hypothetical protein LTR40_000200 [Exophiala xenobiotica]|nr:hypothetical protein LTR40_000200 [Exophiala xenobiotica]